MRKALAPARCRRIDLTWPPCLAKRADIKRHIEQRAQASRTSTRDDRQRLLDLLLAIDAIKAMDGGAPRPAPSGRPLTERVLDAYETSGASYHKWFLRPMIRVHGQNQQVRAVRVSNAAKAGTLSVGPARATARRVCRSRRY
jgi:hypothetical protein